MKLKYQAKKRSRINSRFMGFCSQDENNYWWFDHGSNQWLNDMTLLGKKGFSSHQWCKSIKAFRRKLKKAPKGVKFILVSKWKRHDVIGYGSKELLKDE